MENLTKENLEAMLNAIIADSEEGNLVQHMAFHPEPALETEEGKVLYRDYTLTIRLPDWNIYLDVYTDSEHTLAWMEENGLIAAFENKIATSLG